MRGVKANMLELKLSESDKKIIDKLKLQAVNSDGSLTDLGRYLLIKYDSEKANDRKLSESTLNIPDKVKIGFKDYKVNKIDHEVISDNQVCYGEIQYDNGIINLSTINSKDMKNCALIHECVHGIDDIFDIGLSEEQVTKLGKAMYTFIKDNPQIFAGVS